MKFLFNAKISLLIVTGFTVYTSIHTMTPPPANHPGTPEQTTERMKRSTAVKGG